MRNYGFVQYLSWHKVDADALEQPNISYASTLVDNLRTLSTHNADQSGTISGFLYVPDLIPDDPCYDLSKDYVPTNVTRQVNLPPTDFTLVALAPWINAECTLAYLQAADQDPMRALIFYLPNNGSAQPPPISSPVWDLGDGGSWKSKHGYPVYAVPSDIGQELMEKSSLYSGNLTSVPYGHQISELPGIGPWDYVRMYTQLHVSKTTVIPSLWVLLLIIIAVLVMMVGITSATMHLVWRTRRKSLQRRVASGEVNLEALGIKRLTVPRAHINKLPLFTYNLEEESSFMPVPSRSKKNSTLTTTTVDHDDASEGLNRRSRSQDLPSSLPPVSTIGDTVSNPDSVLAHKYLPYLQPTCPICLDDFESGTTPIRELPCGHIFHPDCIDSFLSNNSSLCPMCKKSVLPKGFCPTNITNAMVRRERNLRRLRSRVMISDEASSVQSYNARNRMRRYQANFRRVLGSNARPSAYADESTTLSMEHHPAVMTNAMPSATNISVLGNVVPETLDPGLTRQEIAQRRIRELAVSLSRRDDSDPDLIDERQRPKC